MKENGQKQQERNGEYGKCAFALCAEGERFVRYRDSLAASLARYVPDADVVDVDVGQAAAILPPVSDRRRSIQMSRLAIPLLDAFAPYDRVVWLDVDTDVVSGRFAGILSVETSADGLAAAEDVFQEKYLKRMEERYPGYGKTTYFNSGVLVMDLRKIDREAWRSKVFAAIEEHAANPFRSPDQDILNRYFDIAPIDRRYNWIHRRGTDPDAAAWLVHYTDKAGHKALEEILSVRSGVPCGRSRGEGRTVVVCPRHAFVRPWIRAYFATGNTLPLVVVEDPDGSWTAEDAAYCRQAADFCGGSVVRVACGRDRNAVLSEIARTMPTSWAWIDDSAEVTGNLDECFDYAERRPGFVCAQFFYEGNSAPDSIDDTHPAGFSPDAGGKICWPSIMLFHGDANERLAEDLSDAVRAKGDGAFGALYASSEAWHEGFCDLSIMGWQAHAADWRDVPEAWSGKIVDHLCDWNGQPPGRVLSAWKPSPAAPFEEPSADGMPDDTPDEDAVDAVFVIGVGSVDDNEELRYALRNLERHCPFVRNVYISGFCPPWVDRTQVIHLNWPDRFFHAKDANIIDKLRHACEHRGIAKRILFCSDDQFQTRVCSWEDFAPRYLRRYASNDRWYEEKRRVWHTRLRNTLEREVARRRSLGLDANEVFYYQPHIWMPVDRDRFVAYAKWSNYEKRTDTIIASGYYNFVGAPGIPDADHAFLRAGTKELPRVTHVAYHDGSEKDAMRLLRAMFPERSRFELPVADRPAPPKAAPPRPSRPTTERSSDMSVKDRARPDEKSGYDPSAATRAELDWINDVSRRIWETPAWNGLISEVSRAEELRLFGVRGWRVVWNDILGRWRAATRNGADPVAVDAPRGAEASSVVNRYLSDPESLRTVRFGAARAPASPVPSFGRQLQRPAPRHVIAPLRDKIRSLRLRTSAE